MDWRSLLTNEAISNYVIFALGLIIGMGTWAVRRWLLPRKAVHVHVEKTDEASLVDIAPEVRDRVTVTYIDTPVDNFHQATFTIFNGGDDVVDGIELDVGFEDNVVILDKVLEDPIGERRQSYASVDEDQASLHIEIPFLNPVRPYRDQIVLEVYSPEPLAVSKITGGGRGWTAQYADRVAYNKMVVEMLGVTLETPTTPATILASSARILGKQIVKMVLPFY